MRGGRVAVASLVVLGVGCGGGSPAKPPPDGAVLDGGGVTDAGLAPDEAPPFRLSGRLVVQPSTLLLTKAGDSAQLTARVYDTAGKPLDRPVTWETSRADAVTVDATGKVTGAVALGSAQITARAGDIVSDPVLVVLAEPTDGALLVTDAQITGQPMVLDPKNAFTPGAARWKVALAGVEEPKAGTIVLAREAKPVGGRVVSATATGGGFEVLLEPVPLFTLFKRLEVRADFPLDARAVALAQLGPPPAPAPGSRALRPDRRPSPLDEPRPPPRRDATFNVGPFECEVMVGVSLISGDVSVRVEPNAALHLDISESADGSYARLRALVEGDLAVTLSGAVRLAPGFEGGVGCSVTLFSLPIPLGGPLAAIGGLRVPFGARLAVAASAMASPLEVKPRLEGRSHVKVGFVYTPQTGFQDLSGVDNTFQPKLNLGELAADDVSFRVEGDFSVGATAALQLGSPVGEALGLIEPLDILDAFLGAKVEFDLAPESAQLDDPGLASNYKVELVGDLGPSGAIEEALRRIGGTFATGAGVHIDKPLGRSPFGALTADKKRVQPGETVHLTVNLDPSALSLAGIDNVKEVHLLRSGPDLPRPTLLKNLGAGQSLSFDWTPQPTDTGAHTFHATVISTLLPVLPLEIAEDSAVVVTIGGGEWSGMASWTLMGSGSAPPSPGRTDVFTVMGSGMVRFESGATPGALAVTAASATYSFQETEDVSQMYVSGGCMHSLVQRRQRTLMGSSSEKPMGVLFFLNPVDQSWFLGVPQPPGMTTGGTRVMAADTVTGGSTCHSPMPTDHTDPETGVMPTDTLTVMGTLSASSPNSISGSATLTFPGLPVLTYQVNYALSR